MATTIQMNVRVDKSLKAKGDSVLYRFGLNPSEFVRAAWEYMAENGTVPEFLKRGGGASGGAAEGTALGSGVAAAEEGLAWKLAAANGLSMPSAPDSLPSYDELREMAYLDRGIERGWLE